MEQKAGELQNLTFYASKDSQLAKSIRSLWIAMGFAILIGVVTSKGSWLVMSISIAMSLLVLLPLVLYLKKKMGKGQPLITLTTDAIESPNLSGNVGKILWHDLDHILLKPANGTMSLQFILKPSAGLPDKRLFLSGSNPSKPTLFLTTFTSEEQEKIIDAINGRLLGVAGVDGQSELINPLRENREFQERLEALSPTPWITYILIGLNLLIWIITVVMGAGISQAPADKLLVWGGNAASEVQRGEWWRLLTATFLHSGLMHVVLNMFGLYSAGLLVERIYGRRLYLIVYFSSGLIGSALSLHFSAQQVVSVGASGAVFGVTGALLVAVFQHRDKLPREFSKQMMSGIGFFIVYSLIQGLGKQGIDNAAHVGGLIGGCLAAFVLPERFEIESFKNKFASRAIISILVGAFAIIGIAATAPLATVDQAKILASENFLKQGMSELQSALNDLKQEQLDVQAGRLTEREADDRSRSIHAPAFRKVSEVLSKVTLRTGDRRDPLLKDAIKLSELLTESLAMDSVFVDGDPKPHPANPVRFSQIEMEIGVIVERMKKNSDELNKKSERGSV